MSDQQQLFNRYINNQCSPEEVEALMMYFHTDQQEDLNVLVLQELERPDTDSNSRSYEALLNDVYHDIQAKIHKDDKVSRPLWYRKYQLTDYKSTNQMSIQQVRGCWLIGTLLAIRMAMLPI